MKSEREAYDRAMNLLSSMGIEMDSIRLDRYCSSPSYMDKLGNMKVFVIPKKNATLNGSLKWKDTMKDFVLNTMPYLEEYHQRSVVFFSLLDKSRKELRYGSCHFTSISLFHISPLP